MNKYFLYLKMLSPNVKKKCPLRLPLEVGAGDPRGRRMRSLKNNRDSAGLGRLLRGQDAVRWETQ
jgi:hypothetical protein